MSRTEEVNVPQYSQLIHAYAALLRANNSEFRVRVSTQQRDLAAIEAWNALDESIRQSILREIDSE